MTTGDTPTGRVRELSVARATVEVERDGTVPPGEGQIVDSQVWHCSDCGDEREFVQPLCTDGHTEDGGPCPEWACVDCGAALLTGGVHVVDVPQVRRAA